MKPTIPAASVTEEAFLPSLFSLENKVAVVTGGSGILGRAIARGLFLSGAQVVLLGTNKDRLAEAVRFIGGPRDRVRSMACNILKYQQVRRTCRRILTLFRRVDILVNAAGGNTQGATVPIHRTVFDIDLREFRHVTDLNFLGTVVPTLIFGRIMAEQGRGSIINISSMAAQRAISRVAGYSAAKAAVENFTKWMAVEMAEKFGDGIRVNAIAPGFFLTEQNRALLTTKDGSVTERGHAIIRMTPFRRFGEPAELVGTGVWLASDASSFVTGCVIPVDGGFSIQSGV